MRSLPNGGTAGWKPSWTPTATPSSSAAVKNGSYTSSMIERPRHGFGRTKAATKPSSSRARRSSRTDSVGDWNGTIAAPRSRSGETAQYSASQSLYARAIDTAASGSVIPQKPSPMVG